MLARSSQSRGGLASILAILVHLLLPAILLPTACHAAQVTVTDAGTAAINWMMLDQQ